MEKVTEKQVFGMIKSVCSICGGEDFCLEEADAVVHAVGNFDDIGNFKLTDVGPKESFCQDSELSIWVVKCEGCKTPLDSMITRETEGGELEVLEMLGPLVKAESSLGEKFSPEVGAIMDAKFIEKVLRQSDR
jgi:hypothetical protein